MYYSGMEISPFKPEFKTDCLAVFKSNIPKYFAEHELEEFTTWLDTGQVDTYYVVKSEGKIVGCGGIYLDPEKNKAGFAWGMIHQDYHKQGFGKAFSEFRIKKIKEMSDLPIYLVTSQYTYEFYRKLGFEVSTFQKEGFFEGHDKYDMKYTL